MTTPETAVTISSIASAATYGGGGGALVAAYNSEWLIGAAGLVIALLGLLVNIYYKQQHLNLARERVKAGLPLVEAEDED